MKRHLVLVLLFMGFYSVPPAYSQSVDPGIHAFLLRDAQHLDLTEQLEAIARDVFLSQVLPLYAYDSALVCTRSWPHPALSDRRYGPTAVISESPAGFYAYYRENPENTVAWIQREWCEKDHGTWFVATTRPIDDESEELKGRFLSMDARAIREAVGGSDPDTGLYETQQPS